MITRTAQRGRGVRLGLNMGERGPGFCMISPYINMDSSIVSPGAFRYLDTDQSGTGTNLELVFKAHPFYSEF